MAGSASAALVYFSFPVLGVSYLAWAAFVPIFVFINGNNYKLSFLSGCFFGLAFYSLYFRWLVHFSFSFYVFTILFGIFIHGVYAALSKFLSAGCKIKQTVLIYPTVWTVLEWVVHQEPLRIPLSYGLTQAGNHSVIQIASTTGVYGISFLLMLSNSMLAQFLVYTQYRISNSNSDILASTRKCCLSNFVYSGFYCFIAVFITIAWYEQEDRELNEFAHNPINVAIIQGNIPIELLRKVPRDNTALKENVSTYLEMLEKALADNPDIVVLPETAIRAAVFNNQETRLRLKSLAWEYNSYIVIGCLSHDNDGVFNSAFVISPNGSFIGRYDKIRLAPFENQRFKSGKSFIPISTDMGVFGIVICFESVFPDMIRSLVKQGSSLVFVLTNEAVFRDSPELYVHSFSSAYRAVENRRYVIRAANTGISQIIDPYGNVIQQGPLHRKAIVTGHVYIQRHKSFYMKYGDVFCLTCLLFLLILALLRLLFRSL